MIFHSNIDVPPKPLIKISAFQGGQRTIHHLFPMTARGGEAVLEERFSEDFVQELLSNGARLCQEVLRSLVCRAENKT